eukprot:CAMPEP_0203994174 /NCGR_PEP_ID=MMETSP0360-20130528/11232_1 /ASSEMBLY_ACC=CAM_ASM_000342 /TAXON_ID=268821 /ORGANISM="Scrippsiella Hangoei, Strain SHTV-5" /LENGTH=61 /DNA_ID=CAMNT_0050934715 /DNA_START=1 /DNA_END=183 /DNA_ORIENTATION=-
MSCLSAEASTRFRAVSSTFSNEALACAEHCVFGLHPSLLVSSSSHRDKDGGGIPAWYQQRA